MPTFRFQPCVRAQPARPHACLHEYASSYALFFLHAPPVVCILPSRRSLPRPQRADDECLCVPAMPAIAMASRPASGTTNGGIWHAYPRIATPPTRPSQLAIDAHASTHANRAVLPSSLQGSPPPSPMSDILDVAMRHADGRGDKQEAQMGTSCKRDFHDAIRNCTMHNRITGSVPHGERCEWQCCRRQTRDDRKGGAHTPLAS